MRSSLLALALLLAAPGSPLAAQDSENSDAGIQASVDVKLGIQRLSGDALGTASARLWLHFGDDWRIGFGGVRGLNQSDGGDLASSGLEAAFGMATVAAGRRLPLLDGLEGTLTLGSGAVSLENSILGTTLDTETVWVLEPALAWRFGTLGPVNVSVEGGYRWIFGSDGLSRLESSDLNTFALGVTLSFDKL